MIMGQHVDFCTFSNAVEFAKLVIRSDLPLCHLAKNCPMSGEQFPLWGNSDSGL